MLFRSENVSYEGKSDDELINETLGVFIHNLKNVRLEILIGKLVKNPIELLLGPQGERGTFFQKYMDSLNRMGDDPELFFKKEEKTFNRIGTKMIKKISKLYDMSKKDN